MANKEYKLNLSWDNGTPQTLTFYIPDNKPADYNMAFKLTNGNTINRTITVGASPNYYDLAVGLTNGKTIQAGTFKTPYYKITDSMFTFNVYDDTENAWAELGNNSLVPITYRIYFQDLGGSPFAIADRERTLNVGDMVASATTPIANLARGYVNIWAGDHYQSLSIGKEATNFIKELQSPKNVYCTFYTTTDGRIDAGYENPNAIAVTAYIKIDGDDGNTYYTTQDTLSANTIRVFETNISSFPNGTIEVYFTASGRQDSSYVVKDVYFTSQLYPPMSLRSSLVESSSSGYYELTIDGWNENNVDCVAYYEIFDKTGSNVGSGAINASAKSVFHDTISLRSGETGGTYYVYFTDGEHEDSDIIQDSVSDV